MCAKRLILFWNNIAIVSFLLDLLSAWHEAIKSINKAWYNLIFGSNITKFGAKLGALLNNQIFIISRFIKILLAS